MKSNIHPTWYHNCTVTCSCGNSFTIGSTQQTLQIDICDKCHPFFTGEVKFVDRQGRVDKFLKQQQAAQAKQQSTKKSKKSDKPAEAKSYRELLQDQQNELRKAAKADATATK
jgi:large subunit ribosomal protein L31